MWDRWNSGAVAPPVVNTRGMKVLFSVFITSTFSLVHFWIAVIIDVDKDLNQMKKSQENSEKTMLA